MNPTWKKHKRWIIPLAIGVVTFGFGINAAGGTTEVEVPGPETTTATAAATTTATATATETVEVEVTVPAAPAPQAPAEPPRPPPLAEDEKPAAEPAPMAEDVYYKNCDAARPAGAAPILRGQPGYRSALDRDNDGVACE